jgi:hypothetical protein
MRGVAVDHFHAQRFPDVHRVKINGHRFARPAILDLHARFRHLPGR